MTDSMKFGPEWLRNMSDSSISGNNYQNNANSVVGNSGNSGNIALNLKLGIEKSTFEKSTFSIFVAPTVNTRQDNANTMVNMSITRNLFPEFRYGREEMLSLFNKNCEMPEILPSYKNLYIEKVQCPLALTPSTEADMLSLSVQLTMQKPPWLQRSLVGFNNSPRSMGRGNSNDRGRIRPKSIYNSTFQRSTVVFDEDIRVVSKSDRNVNNAGDAISAPSNLDRNSTPTSSPRREFPNHLRNVENWRCNRSEENSTETSSFSGGDGWRVHNNSNSNISTQRWGRSTSWRDDDLPIVNSDTLTSGPVSSNNNSTLIQRPFSSFSNSVQERDGDNITPQKSLQNSTQISTVAENSSNNVNDMFSELNGKNTVPLKHSRHNQWSVLGGTNIGANIDGATETNDDKNLPEWAMENTSPLGGTFDATGAFHGGVVEDEVCSDDTRGNVEEYLNKDFTSSFSSYKEDDGIRNKGNELLNHKTSNKNEDTTAVQLSGATTDSFTKIVQSEKSEKNIHDTVCILSAESGFPVAKGHKSEKSSTRIMTSENNTSSVVCNLSSNSENILINDAGDEYSDPMMHVTDDMIEKLIMDDDDRKNHTEELNDSKILHSILINDLSKPNMYPPYITSDSSISSASSAITPIVYNVRHQQAQQLQHFQMLGREGRPLGLSSNLTLHPVSSNAPSELWFYRDPQSKIQGPFSTLEMTEWYRAGYFNENLYVRRVCDVNYRSLGELLKLCKGQMPFTNSHLIPIDFNSLTTTQNLFTTSTSQTEYSVKDLNTSQTQLLKINNETNNLKNSVNTMDFLNSARFHTFLHSQEVEISGELEKNRNYEFLSAHNQEDLVGQKLQMAIPEILGNLNTLSQENKIDNPNTSIENSLPLYNSITQCSEKDPRLFKSHILDTISDSTFVNTSGDCMILKLQQPKPKSENNASAFTDMKKIQENDANRGSISNDAANDLSLRMILKRGNSVDAGNTPVSNNYLSEQQIFGKSSPEEVISTSQSPIIQMWMNQLSTPCTGNNNQHMVKACHTIINPPMPTVHTTEALSNQWNKGSLVYLPNALVNHEQMGSILELTKSVSPTSIWDVNILEQYVQMQQQNEQHKKIEKKQQNQFTGTQENSNTDNFHSTNEQSGRAHYKEHLENLTATSEDSGDNFDEQINIKLQKPELQESETLLNNNHDHINLVDNDNKKQRKLEAFIQPLTTTDNCKHGNSNNKTQYENSSIFLNDLGVSSNSTSKISQNDQYDEKKKHKDERKGQQQHEEKEHNLRSQSQRGKATINSNNNLNANAFTDKNSGDRATTIFTSLNIQKPSKDQQPLHKYTSIAPWSTQKNVSIGPSLAEIQKAERRERRADQQRQIEMQEKRTLATSDGQEILKWNSSSVLVKSLTEIQAEEAKRLTYEQVELQRRKEKEQQTKLNMGGSINTPVAGCLSTISGNTKNIWGGTKIWGGYTNNEGFWEDINRKKSGNVSINNITTAAIVAQCPQTQKPKTKYHSTSDNAVKVIKKTQTVLISENTLASTTCKKKLTSFSTKNQQCTSKTSKQSRNQKAVNEKKNTQTTNNASSSKMGDDYEAEFFSWCTMNLNKMGAKVDVPTFAAFLRDLESPYEVKDYIRVYLGESKEYIDFGKQFLERRSKYKNLQRAQNAHNDDLCKPAQAITPSINDSNDSRGKQKKVKKNKMTKLDANILGFSVTAAEGRINVGDRDYVDAP